MSDIARVGVVGAGFMGSGIAESCARAGVDAVLEAVIEDPRVKGRLFQELDVLLPDAVFLASNTSSIPIAEIASWTSKPERVIGVHFFSPVPVMSLTEV